MQFDAHKQESSDHPDMVMPILMWRQGVWRREI
jgi:hypothetical protein